VRVTHETGDVGLAETYRIDLLGFPGASSDEAVSALVLAFGIAANLARTYVDEAPITVRTGIDGNLAREYTQTLLRIGASVRVLAEATGREREFTLRDLEAVLAAENGASPANGEEPGPGDARRWVTEDGLPPEGSEEEEGTAPWDESAVSWSASGDPATEGERGWSAAEAAGALSAATAAGAMLAARAAEFEPVEEAAEAPAEEDSSEAPPAAPPDSPAAPGRGARPEEEIDVFENLRTSRELEAVRAAAVRRRARTARRQEAQVRLRASSRRRAVLYGVLLLLIVATLVALAMLPSDDKPRSDPLPSGAPEAPPGFRFRRF
jgi:hypothetical protein